jgi:hypothetical protein
MGDEDPKLYKKGWDGQYRPDFGLFGERHAGEPFGPQVKTGLLTGEPVPARDFLGNQKKASDGTPLYETTSGGLGGDVTDAAATGIVMVTIGIAVAAAVATAAAGKVVVQRFVASARADVHDRRLSLATAGYGLVILWVAGFVLSSLVGPRSSGGFAFLAWGLDDVAFISVIVLGLCYAPAQLGELARARRDTRQPVEHFWRWVAAAVGSAGLTLAFVSELNSYPQTHPWVDGYVMFLLIVFVAGLALAQVGAFAWGWNGRPDVVRPTIESIRQRTAMRSHGATSPPSDEQPSADAAATFRPPAD